MAQSLTFITRFSFLLFILIAVSSAPGQTGPNGIYPSYSDKPESSAPLTLIVNGEGRVSPFKNGQVLPLGWWLTLTAIPDRGYVFVGWQKVNVITDIQIINSNPSGEFNGSTSAPIFSTVVSPVGQVYRDSTLKFEVGKTSVLYDVPGVETITETTGWEADFVPVKDIFH